MFIKITVNPTDQLEVYGDEETTRGGSCLAILIYAGLFVLCAAAMLALI